MKDQLNVVIIIDHTFLKGYAGRQKWAWPLEEGDMKEEITQIYILSKRSANAGV